MRNSNFGVFSIFLAITGLSFASGGYESEYHWDLIETHSPFEQLSLPEKECLISDLDAACPPNSHCTELSDQHGECFCTSGYIFNALYTNDKDYCFLDHTTILPAAISISGPSSSSTTPPHHHIVGGILIPLVLVAAFVGGAYLVVRYRLLQRIRDRALGRRRRHRPTYHMGTEFEPPLI